MPEHTARSLFVKNLQSSEECIALYDSLLKLAPKGINLDWILRASVVFTVSAIDAYFHDKIKYGVGKYSNKIKPECYQKLPKALAKFQIPISSLPDWQKATRKGNVLTNWITKYYSTRPLQSPSEIADALKVSGIEDFWNRIEPKNRERSILFKQYNDLIRRRNQISHEGDRKKSRASGKSLNTITREEVGGYLDFSKGFIIKIEKVFPN
jgi:hypothetical protein